MGLTLHYSLHSNSRSVTDVRKLLSMFRLRALDLAFREVGEFIELKDDACNFDRLAQDDPSRWLLIQASQSITRSGRCFNVPPNHVIAFRTWPGIGCEPANFGLCRFPATIKDGHRLVQTGLTGWTWSSFCKTQYASNPEAGGVENFLRCHLSLIKMLDYAKAIGILADVDDEGEFWKRRDVKALAGEVGDWNTMPTGWVDRLKTVLGKEVEAAIAKPLDFKNPKGTCLAF
ncbi:MAG: hypothetical protein NTW19_07955 [Planctomycetota bacterium]|nr:hypothetical protein [Planctomycetota bacterium]